MKKEYDLVVVGAGPAGIMAALTAKKYNDKLRVALVDSGKSIGQKLAITGGGRCNFTNNRSIDEFFDMVVNNNKFLYSSFYGFTNEDLKDFIRGLGLDYSIESGNDQKVYIKSGRAQDLIRVLDEKIRASKIDLYLDSKVNDIGLGDEIKTVKFNDYILNSNKLLFATGGLSFPKTGSDGSVMRLLQDKGYDIVTPRPGLVPIEVKEGWSKDLAGISLKDVLVWIQIGKRKKELIGDLMFTHKGLGGPAILKISSYINNRPFDRLIYIDFLPGMTRDQIYKLAIKDRKKTILANLKGSLPNNFTKLLIQEVGRQTGLDLLGQTTANMTRDTIDLVISSIKQTSFTVKSLASIEIATITAGGISHKQINPTNMESKLHPGIYFSGEMIDVDALTGGFNLQIAFSTGYLAGRSLAEKF